MAKISDDSLTAVYYTANVITDHFRQALQKVLLEALGDTPLISVSKQPIDFGENIVVDTPRSHIGIYRDALTGVKAAKTKYVALCEDDVLYSPEHFKHRSSPGKFAYNLGCWSIFTWSNPPMYSHKGTVRYNLNSLICEREAFIEAMEERFALHPIEKEIHKSLWSEPGKYEAQLGVTVRETEAFYANPPNIVFSHEEALAFENLGTKKRVGEFRAYEIPYWGRADKIMEMYREV